MKVGDYVRTKDNKIYKIIDKKFDETILVDLYQTDISGYLMEIDIKKSSPNIIDLIEVGDYVKGHKVLEKNLSLKWWDDDEGEQDEEQGLLLEGYGYIYPSSNHNYKPFTIVTKEQFESMEYEIGE